MEERSTMKKYVYMFPEGNGKMRELLGGKGANLAEMTGLGMPVPQGFTITTEACTRYYEDGKTIYPDIQEQILEYLDKLEKVTGKTLGDPEKPLLVSVRSGARASMPGMMDTEPRHERRDLRGCCQADEQSAFRTRFLPPLHPDVL